MIRSPKCLRCRKSLALIACLLLIGCGGGNSSDQSLDSFYGDASSSPSGSETPTTSKGISGSSGAAPVDTAMLSDAARKATEYLNGMSGEYESFYGSGQGSVQLKQTEAMYQLINPVSSKVANSAAPPVEAANKLKQETLPGLLEAIKRAEIARLHFEREYSTSSFGMSAFSRGGHEIGDGIRAARVILDKIQYNIPLAEKLTTGAPPTIGGPPATNRSFGFLQTVSLNPTQYQGFHDRQGRQEMVPWRMVVDAPTQPYEIGPETKLDLDAALADVSPTAFYDPVNVLYPAMPSLHVGIGLNEVKAQQRQVWSLEPKLRKGIVKGIQLQKSDMQALSADGAFFAARPENTSIIGLFDVAKGSAVGQIEQTFAAGAGGEKLFFSADNRLVLIAGSKLHIWSVPGLKPERTLDIKSPTLRSHWNPGYAWTLSPGGRYLAVPSFDSFSKEVRFYDLTTGETSANLNLGSQGHVNFIAVSFSKDGTKLAVLLEGPWNTWIQVWDVASGQLTASYTKDSKLSGGVKGDAKYQGPSVDWFPDGRRILLYGKGVFDTQTGQGTKLITSTVRYPVKPLGGDAVGVLMKKQFVAFDLKEIPENPVRWETEKLKMEVAVADNPFAVVETSQKPAPLATDRSGIRYLSLQGGNWSVSADPASGELAIVGQPRTVSLPNFTSDNVYHAAVAGNQSKVAVGYTDKGTRIWDGKISGLETLKAWVELADLNAETGPTRFDLPFPCGLHAISPTGKRLLTRDFNGFNRFDIWDVQAQQQLAGFVPYAQGRTDGGAPILWTDFIDDQRVLTLTAGQLTCWSIPDGKAIYEIELSQVSATPVFSPGRQQLALLHDQKLSILSTASGDVLGQLTDLGVNGELTALSYRADGAELAVLSTPVGGGEVALLNVGTGTVEKTFPIPVTGKSLEYCNDDFVLIDGGYCISLEKNAVAWIYHLDGVRIASSSGTTKYFLSKSSFKAPLTLHSTSLPTSETVTAIAAQDPPNNVILSAGGNIALDIQIPSPPGRGNFTEDVRAAFSNQFADNNISISPAAPLTLVVRGSQNKTGEGISLGSFGSSFSRGSQIDEEKVTWVLTIKLENQTLWQRTVSANNTGGVNLDDGISGQAAIAQATQQLQENMWKKAASALLAFHVPKYVFGPEAGAGLGSSKLGETK